MASTHRLYLLRHARAEPAQPGQSDYDRSLSLEGRADAAALGRLLLARGVVFQRVVSSGAARTRETWRLVAEAGLEAPLTIDDALYHDGEAAYLAAASRDAPDDTVLVGHNPTIGDCARRLAMEGEAWAIEALSRGFPTCALAVLRVDGGLPSGHAFLEDLLMPPFPAR